MSPVRLALANTAHERARTLISIVGAAFAVLLIFMQLGFLGATGATATVFYGQLKYDLVVVSAEYLDFSRPGSIERNRVAAARGVTGVASALPLSTGQGLWRTPGGEFAGRKLAVTAVGVPPGALGDIFHADAFPDGGPGAAGALIARTGALLLDRKSRRDFGRPPPGSAVEFNGRRHAVAGYFKIGTGFSYTGLVLLGEETYARSTGRPPDEVNFALVTIDAGESPETVRERARAALGPGVLVMTRAELEAQERNYWVNKTAIGQLFYAGVLLAFSVGAIFVYQMIAADIKKHLPEYATLKAVGYKYNFLFGVVVWQSVFLALGGYAVGLVGAVGFYRVTTAASGLPMRLEPWILMTVMGFTLLMVRGVGAGGGAQGAARGPGGLVLRPAAIYNGRIKTGGATRWPSPRRTWRWTS